jgi:hypothetical protein
MKKLFFLLIFIGLSFSCTEDSVECTPESPDKNLIGTWTGRLSLTSQTGEITFRSNGTGTGTGIFETRINNIPTGSFTWSYVSTNNALTLSYNTSGGGSIIEYIILSNQCNEVRMNFRDDITLIRQ